MSKTIFGKLSRVELREIWTNEANDFTPWLAIEENLQLLGDTIGLELELEAQEKEVGPYRADILCRDTSNGNWVLVENQLEKTDHTHLGQLITYAAGLGTVTIVWIAKRFTEEHRAALDWLNSITSDQISFIGLEIEVWQIGESEVAPKLNIIAKPNDWTRGPSGIKSQFVSNVNSPTLTHYLEYWTAFCDFLKDDGTFLKIQKPHPQYWHVFAVGKSGFHLSASINAKERKLGCTLVMEDENAKIYFDHLLKEKDEIEKEFDKGLVWREMPEHKSSRISCFIDGDTGDKAAWSEQNKQLKALVEKFHATFSRRIRALKNE